MLVWSGGRFRLHFIPSNSYSSEVYSNVQRKKIVVGNLCGIMLCGRVQCICFAPIWNAWLEWWFCFIPSCQNTSYIWEVYLDVQRKKKIVVGKLCGMLLCGWCGKTKMLMCFLKKKICTWDDGNGKASILEMGNKQIWSGIYFPFSCWYNDPQSFIGRGSCTLQIVELHGILLVGWLVKWWVECNWAGGVFPAWRICLLHSCFAFSFFCIGWCVTTFVPLWLLLNDILAS